MRTSLLTSSLLLAFVACGGDDAPTPTHGSINTTSASSSIANMGKVVASMGKTDASGAADAVMALTAAGQGVVLPTGSARELPAELPVHWPEGRQAFTGTASCTANDCSYHDFGDDTPYGSYRLNGTISRRGDRLTFDLTWVIRTASAELSWEMDGDVTANATLIDGEVHSHGESSGSTDSSGSYSVTWDLDIGFENIRLDGGQCPISGALDATVSLTSSSGGRGGSWAARGRVTYGPACGQYTLD